MFQRGRVITPTPDPFVITPVEECLWCLLRKVQRQSQGPTSRNRVTLRTDCQVFFSLDRGDKKFCLTSARVLRCTPNEPDVLCLTSLLKFKRPLKDPSVGLVQ